MAEAPAFDPTKPFESATPAFDPSKPFDPIDDQPPPQSFMDRVARGDALNRAVAPFVAAAKGAAEGFGSEPIGLSDEHFRQLQDMGVFRDQATGRGGALRPAQQINCTANLGAWRSCATRRPAQLSVPYPAQSASSSRIAKGALGSPETLQERDPELPELFHAARRS